MSGQPPKHTRDLARYEAAYRASRFEETQAAYRKRMLLELLERVRPARVLEVGCGVDTLAAHWRGADRFVIVEPGEGFAATAREQTTGQAGVSVIEATMEAAAGRLAGESFDLVLLSGLLHEVSDVPSLLAATRAVCGPHTLVHANVPNARSLHRLLALEMGLIRDVTETSPLQAQLQQPRVFTAETLSEALQAAGFEVVDQGSYFIKPFTHGQMQQLVEQGFLTPEILDGLYGLARHLPGVGSEIFANARLKGAG